MDSEAATTDPDQFEFLADMALRAIATPYPFHVSHVVTAATDTGLPRDLHPSFGSCFDWHSAVHSHWALVRLLRTEPTLRSADTMAATLSCAFAPDKLRAEADYLAAPGRQSFERPYGLAWALLLAAELAGLEHPLSRDWRDAFAPLEQAAAANLLRWLGRLRLPVRSGAHQNSAFALALILDWARARGLAGIESQVATRCLELFGQDRQGPLDYEPSAEDFLSGCLMEADLMSRVLPTANFALWLDGFLPQIPTDRHTAWLEVARVGDESDGKSVHLHGLNLSRAWNLTRLAAALPPDDLRIGSLRAASLEHRRAGLTATRSVTDFASTHWLASFAVYLLTDPAARPLDRHVLNPPAIP